MPKQSSPWQAMGDAGLTHASRGRRQPNSYEGLRWEFLPEAPVGHADSPKAQSEAMGGVTSFGRRDIFFMTSFLT